jgi:type VI secretion system secreted protein VgrG
LAQGAHLDRQELMALLDDCGELFRGLGQTATAQGAQGGDDNGLSQLQDALAAWPEAEGHDGAPVVAVAGEAGIICATPESQLHYAGTNHDVVATDHVQSVSGGATRLQAGRGLSLYTQDDGIQAIANRGKVLIQAQDDDIALNAQSNLHASASDGEVLVTAPTIRLVADDGSYIRIGNGIEIGTQGDVKVHGVNHDWLGPKVDSAPIPAFGREPADQQFLFHYSGHSDDKPMLALGHAYRMVLEDGSEAEGEVDSLGMSARATSSSMQRVTIHAIEAIEDAGEIVGSVSSQKATGPDGDRIVMLQLKDEVNGND